MNKGRFADTPWRIGGGMRRYDARAFNTMTRSKSDDSATVAIALLALLCSERAESYLDFFSTSPRA